MDDTDALAFFSKVHKKDFERYIDYIGQIYAADSTDKKLEKEIDNISVRCGHLDGKIKGIKSKLKRGNMDEIFNQCMEIAKAMSRLSSDLSLIPVEYGFKERGGGKTTVSLVTEEKDVKFIREEGFLRILLPELLPHRPQYDVFARRMKYFYDINAWKNNYYSAFRQEFATGKYRIYGEKVVFYFLHHVKGQKPDIDNLETKGIIDLITLFLLVDDDYKHACHFMDMVDDSESYTEIIICPYRIFWGIIPLVNKQTQPRLTAGLL